MFSKLVAYMLRPSLVLFKFSVLVFFAVYSRCVLLRPLIASFVFIPCCVRYLCLILAVLHTGNDSWIHTGAKILFFLKKKKISKAKHVHVLSICLCCSVIKVQKENFDVEESSYYQSFFLIGRTANKQRTINPKDRKKPSLGSRPKSIISFWDFTFTSVATW